MKKKTVLLIFLLAWGCMLCGALTPGNRKEIQALQKELTVIEKTLDDVEAGFWQGYFSAPQSDDYVKLNEKMGDFSVQIRSFKNRILRLEKQGVIPVYMRLSSDYAVEAVLPRLRVLLAQHRLYGKWNVKIPMRLTSRQALKFKHVPTKSNIFQDFGLSADDEKYLLQVNHQLNYNMKYHFRHRDTCRIADHDCRTHLRGGKLDTQIRDLDVDSSEYFDAVLQARKYILRTEILLYTIASGFEFPAKRPRPSEKFNAVMARTIREAQKKLDCVSDDFWCGYFFADQSVKYNTLRRNLFDLSALLRFLRNKAPVQARTLRLQESAVAIYGLLRPTRKITYNPDWQKAGWSFLTIKEIEPVKKKSSLESERGPVFAAAKKKSSKSSKKKKSEAAPAEEKAVADVYQKNFVNIQNGLRELAKRFPMPK